MDVKRGDLFRVSFEPSVGGEIKKRRPAVVVSTDKANPYLNRVVVIPVSSNISEIYPSEVKITFQGKESKAMADQIRTISKQRLISKIGTLPPEELKKIEEKIKLFLELL
ncbi:MAG: type II toxin-antitoxin system PemK/MazF family toxin [Candidatus Omnitrophota bacterium]